MKKFALFVLALTVFGSHVSAETLTIDWLAENFETCDQDGCLPPPFESAFGSFTISADFSSPIEDTSAGVVSSSQSFGIDYDFGYSWDFNDTIGILLIGGLDQFGVSAGAISGADFALGILNPFSDAYSNSMLYRTDAGVWGSNDVKVLVWTVGDDDAPSPVPLPASALLLGAGLGLLTFSRKRKSQAA